MSLGISQALGEIADIVKGVEEGDEKEAERAVYKIRAVLADAGLDASEYLPEPFEDEDDLDGTEGQDRDSYTDDQDRDSYVPST